jgi:hypothetical protein
VGEAAHNSPSEAQAGGQTDPQTAGQFIRRRTGASAAFSVKKSQIERNRKEELLKLRSKAGMCMKTNKTETFYHPNRRVFYSK